MHFLRPQLVVLSLLCELFGARFARAADSEPQQPELSTAPDTEQPRPSAAPDTDPTAASSQPQDGGPWVTPTAPGWNDPPGAEASDEPRAAEAPEKQPNTGEGALGS